MEGEAGEHKRVQDFFVRLVNPEDRKVLVARSAVDVEFYSIIFYCREAFGFEGDDSARRTREVELSRVRLEQGEQKCL